MTELVREKPSLLHQAVEGVSLMGWRKSLQVLAYTVSRTWWDWRYAPIPLDWATDGRGPGRLLAKERLGPGFTARFEDADLEVRYLTADLVRVTWHPGTDPLPYAIARDQWPDVEEPELGVELDEDGALSFLSRTGLVLRRDQPPVRHGDGWHHQAALRSGEQVHGMGERSLPFDLRGRACTNWNSEPDGHYSVGRDPIYACIPTYMGVHDEGSYLVFYENSHRSEFSFGTTTLDARFDGGALRYYMILGPLPRALERYADLTGRPAMPPRWVLGYHQSRWGYPSATHVRRVAEGFREHDMPLSAIHLDIEHMDRYRVFTVDERHFPDFAGLARELTEHGVRLVPIVDAAVARHPGYGVYDEGLAENRFCTLPNGRVLSGVVWPGWAAFPDFTDAAAREWWGRQYRTLADAGVAGYWHDMNEPTTFALAGGARPPLATHHAMDGRGGTHAEGRNVYALLMAKAAHDGLVAAAPDRRPFLVSRSGWAGLQRYAWLWTGDTHATWAMLRQTVATVLGLSMSGIPFTGPDIGGYKGTPSEELYLRWLQLAVFLPFCRTHSAYDTAAREPWAAAPNHEDTVRALLHLRYRLLPFLYTLAWEAATTGHPLVRPLFWHDEADPALRNVDDAFLLGDHVVVAPVLDEDARVRQVRLPPGRWYPFDGDEAIEGGRTVEVAAPLEAVPVFVRAGAVLPLDDDGQLTLHLYAPDDGGIGGGVLYTDSGDGHGPSRVDRYRVTRSGDTLRVESRSEGAYPPTPSRTVVHGPARLG